MKTDEVLDFCAELEKDIEGAYSEGTNLEQAERLAAKFLTGQLLVSKELEASDLDSRMRKSGLKAIKAAVYMEAATKGDKKPSDTFLQSVVDMDQVVGDAQNLLDSSEVNRDKLERYYNIFREAHVFFRGVSKGRFE